MSSLLDKVGSFLSGSPQTTSSNSVPTSKPLSVSAVSTSAVRALSYGTPPFISNPTNPILQNVPQNMRPLLGKLTNVALSTATGKYGPSAMSGAGSVVDVASKVFQGNVNLDTFVQLQRGIAAMAPNSGIGSAKVSNIVNVVSGIVNSGIIGAAGKALGIFGTTSLPAAEYEQYAQTLVEDVGAKLTESFGIGPDNLAAVRTAVETFPVKLPSIAGVELPKLPTAPVTPTISMIEHDDSSDKKVYLRSAIAGNTNNLVLFRGQPKISITEVAEYDIFNPIHAPTGFASFRFSQPREIQITDIKLFSRTSEEASQNLQALHMLRSWTKPYFGLSQNPSGANDITASTVPTAGSAVSSQAGGAPPDILFLYAYTAVGSGGDDEISDERNLYRVPVVIRNVSFDYPNDVDYISTVSGTPFPIIMNISLSLLETHSPDEAEKFSLQDFRLGRMLEW